ncbi:hypothetical protein NEIMUCOT_06438 [Neisseria mucosa ATCC 25996]|uniref:Uncharacterized protein n=1 Tax=Neisseria mucosa (strain ATCC 25996 / DSM 4631 / NCTC 10774 / M26) TaxID=546266 RepID=D3A0K2_NEIM2|nr:hypothetical protein NEIMUCOT_06438 [Neisseria mucosa ATCC 25996]
MDGIDGDVAAFGDRHHFGVGDVAVKPDTLAGVLFEPVQIRAAAHDVQLYIFAVVQQFANAFAHGFHVIAVTERTQVEETGFVVTEVFCRRGIEFREIRADIDDFAGNVRIGFFGAVEVGLRYGDQCVGVAVGAVGAGGEGQQVVRDFFQKWHDRGERLRPYVLHVDNQFVAQTRFVFAQEQVSSNQWVGGKDDVLLARTAVVQPLLKIFDEHMMAFDAVQRDVFAVAALFQQHDFQTTLRGRFGIFRSSERFVIVFEIAGNQQYIMRLRQQLGKIPEAVEMWLGRQRTVGGDDGDVHIFRRPHIS